VASAGTVDFGEEASTVLAMAAGIVGADVEIRRQTRYWRRGCSVGGEGAIFVAQG
jgi:hypothetical protein